MLLKNDGARNRPKITSSVGDYIFHGGDPPFEFLRYQYRKMFHLSRKQMDEEDSVEFFTNLFIHAEIAEKQRLEAKNG